ncbi:CPBP family intramembrane metalloprotease [Candidatus Gracilibacteria bacterium]|nr:CPBP family intramembrane metalloprotease [Candidatus Gracilibacteria bacterium]
MPLTKNNIFETITLCLLALSGVFLIGLQFSFGWIFVILGILSLFLCRKNFSKDIGLIYLSLIILSISKINTDISYFHMIEMGSALIAAIAIPYIISKYYYKQDTIKFPWSMGRKWNKKEIAYILLAGIIAYFLIPFYVKNTGAYLNWNVEPGISHIARLFIGTNALGIWDELFFISTVLGVLRKWLPFLWANILQAILFTSFLHELGFSGWGFVMIYIFALLQGIIFKKTESLAYIITIHLVIDFVLFLALIEAHHPTWMPIFLT